jgi:hypothetical protein
VELCGYREQLLSIGDTVTSRWLDFRKMPRWSCGIARDDCKDLMAADAVIIFSEIPNTILATGGRHVEFGLALAQGRRVIIVGPREGSGANCKKVRRADTSALGERESLACKIGSNFKLYTRSLYCPFRVLTPVTPITTCAVPLGDLDPAGLRACSKDVSPLCHAYPIPCSRRDNSVLEERLRRRASAKLC